MSTAGYPIADVTDVFYNFQRPSVIFGTIRNLHHKDNITLAYILTFLIYVQFSNKKHPHKSWNTLVLMSDLKFN